MVKGEIGVPRNVINELYLNLALNGGNYVGYGLFDGKLALVAKSEHE